ncbi:polysaccharide deacetylase family protein [Flavobacterium aquicola]|uniref:Polysaccharide deacetylase n=1 Tax=Flavobacterium aquicola TaxID=1682742 RepID=A0A3E0ETB0_9FLAO|nr:polysaccharide deacetylase family protein [Flavobacterium aquicola]REH01024.1 polysaccharide deacetylase [Flavobacterium aquicola]
MGFIKDNLYRISNKNLVGLFKKQSVYPYYHIIRDDKAAHIENLYQYKNIAQFKNDLEVLSKNFSPLSLGDLTANKNNGFLISFDDGLEEIYSVVFPILKEKNLKAIFFVNPVFVDNNEGLYKHYISVIINHLKDQNFRKESLDTISSIFNFSYISNDDFTAKFKNIRFSDRNKITDVLSYLNIDIHHYLKTQKPYISKEQIQEMIDQGFYFGGHTMSHPPLEQLSFEEQKKEIIDSIDWVKNTFSIDYSLFAFPFSDKKISKRLLTELLEYDKDILLFGNSGLKKDFDNRIIQRFSIEHPKKDIKKIIVTENLFKYYNKVIGKYKISRK